MEEHQIYHRHRYICIRYIEYRTEEVVVVVHQERQPARHVVPLEQREVEHINHLAHQECAVTLAQRSHRERCRGCEDHSVEHRVDQITHRTCKNQRQTNNHTARRASLGTVQVVDVVAQTANHHYAEQAQQQLAPVYCARRVELHTEGRTVVLHKVEVEPRQDLYRLVQAHRGFDPHLDDLVQHHKDED